MRWMATSEMFLGNFSDNYYFDAKQKFNKPEQAKSIDNDGRKILDIIAILRKFAQHPKN